MREPVIEETSNFYGDLFDLEDEWNEADLQFLTPAKVASDIQNKACLDAGCGYGRVTEMLARLRAKEIHGIDIGERCVRKTLARANTFSNVHVRVGDITNLPYVNDYFDFVFCSGVLHHTLNPYKGFVELTRVAKPGGKIVVGVYSKGGFRWPVTNFLRLFTKFVPYQAVMKLLRPFNSRNIILDRLYAPIQYQYSESEIRQWFKNNGIINVTDTDHDLTPQNLWGKLFAGKRWIQLEGYKQRK